MTKLNIYWQGAPNDDMLELNLNVARQLSPCETPMKAKFYITEDTEPFVCLEPFNPPIPQPDPFNHPQDQWAELIAYLDDRGKAYNFLQIVGDHTEKENSREFKLFAMELAEVLGPDHCQTLYRLAVLATKLA